MSQLDEDSSYTPQTPSHHPLSDVASKSEVDDELSYIDTTTTQKRVADMNLRTRYFGGSGGGPRKLMRKNTGEFAFTYKGEVLGDANKYYDY